MSIASFLGVVARVILNPLIVFGFLVALLYFFFGIFQFVFSGSNPTAHEEGKQAILWGLIGMFIMVSVLGIVHIIINTFGIPISQSPYLGNLLQQQ